MRVVTAALAVALAIAAPARAEVGGIIECSTTAPANGQSNCTMVVEPGTYQLDLTSTAAFATATVACNGALEDPLYVSVSGGGHRTTTGTLLDPLCTLSVTATSGGTATGHVFR